MFRTSKGKNRDTYSTIFEKWSIHLTENLYLNLVFHVPNLSVDLLFVSKLTRDLKCFVIFSPSQCVFQDQTSRRKIGFAKEKDGLFYLEKINEVTTAYSTNQTNKKK